MKALSIMASAHSCAAVRTRVMTRLNPFPLAVVFVFAALFFSAAGCSSAGANAKKNYSQALNRWTRAVNISDGLDVKLHITATYKAAQFRDAYLELYSESYQLDEDLKKTVAAREAELTEEYNEFFIAAYAPDEKWNDLHLKNSIWQLYLSDNLGNKLTPITVKRADPSDPRIREYFPFFDVWSSGYIVRFPRYTATGSRAIPGTDTEFVKLTVTGILGNGEVEWRLTE